jgi:UrcA family protein
MDKVVICALSGALAAALIGGAAVAQQAEDVTVQATRIPNIKTVGHTMSGIPIKEMSLSYRISTAGLDLASHAGAMGLEKRVQDAAMEVCRELGKKYPDSTPNDADCAKEAADKAMVQVHELEAASAKK